MTIIRDTRFGCLIWLLCSAVIAGLGFWYPMFVFERHGAPDDRSGGVSMIGLLFCSISAGIAITAFIALLDAVRREKLPRLYFVRLIGGLLTLFSLSPLLVLARNMFIR